MSSQYFPSYNNKSKITLKLDLSNYITKTDLKSLKNIDIGSFALKTNLAYLKTEVGKLDIGNLKTVPKKLLVLANNVTVFLSYNINVSLLVLAGLFYNSEIDNYIKDAVKDFKDIADEVFLGNTNPITEDQKKKAYIFDRKSGGKVLNTFVGEKGRFVTKNDLDAKLKKIKMK